MYLCLTRSPLDLQRPKCSELFRCRGTFLTAVVDDSAKGGSQVVSARYTVNNEPTAMDATDGSFDQTTESVAALIPPQLPGIYDICVRGTDSEGNVGAYTCVQLIVEGADLVITKTGFVAPVTIDIPNTASVVSDLVDPIRMTMHQSTSHKSLTRIR